MRIVIETDEGKEASVQGEPSAAAGEDAAATPPPEVAARAAAEGALSAGPAPELPRDEGGPTTFLPEPSTPASAPQTGPGAIEDASAGAAPDFALGDLAVDEQQAEEEEDAEEEKGEG
jgi:hypothetical protein